MKRAEGIVGLPNPAAGNETARSRNAHPSSPYPIAALSHLPSLLLFLLGSLQIQFARLARPGTPRPPGFCFVSQSAFARCPPSDLIVPTPITPPRARTRSMVKSPTSSTLGYFSVYSSAAVRRPLHGPCLTQLALVDWTQVTSADAVGHGICCEENEVGASWDPSRLREVVKHKVTRMVGTHVHSSRFPSDMRLPNDGKGGETSCKA